MFNEIYDNFMGMWFFLNLYSTSSLSVVWTEPWLDQRILKEFYLILYLCTCEHAMNPKLTLSHAPQELDWPLGHVIYQARGIGGGGTFCTANFFL